MQKISSREAQLFGLKRFFTGKTCKHGHLAERYVNGGHCVVCMFATANKRDKANPEKKYARNRKRRQNNQEALQAQQRIWRANNRARVRANDNRRRKENIEHFRELDRARYKANPEKQCAYSRQWYAGNRDKVLAYANANAEKRLANGRQWRKKHPDKARALNHLRRSRRRAAEGEFSAADIESIRKLQRNRCAEPTCRKKFKHNEHIDHIVPLAKGGTNWRNNIQLLCAKCNNVKWATDPLTHARRLGRFI